jgi:hypothetical protein
MRTSILAIAVVAIAVPAMAQQSTTTGQQQIQSEKQMQEEADKGIKTRDSGESGFVGQQERPGSAAHAPGQPSQGNQTTGAAPGSGQGSATGGNPR